MAGRQFHHCPNCGSHQVQSVEAAYFQSIRHGRDFSTISEFGKQLAPPEAKSTVVVPGVAGGTVYVAAAVSLDFAADVHLPTVPWGVIAEGHGSYFVFALLAALAVALGVSIRAARYNNAEHPERMRRWKSELVCRACLQRFPGSHRQGGR